MPTLFDLSEITNSNPTDIFYIINNAGDTEYKVERRYLFSENGNPNDLSTTGSPTFDNITISSTLSANNIILDNYSPTITIINGISSITAQNISYFYIGNVYEVTGIITAVADGINPATLRLTLPDSKTFSSTSDVTGVCQMDIPTISSYLNCSVYADTTNDEIILESIGGISVGGNTIIMKFTASYLS